LGREKKRQPLFGTGNLYLLIWGGKKEAALFGTYGPLPNPAGEKKQKSQVFSLLGRSAQP